MIGTLYYNLARTRDGAVHDHPAVIGTNEFRVAYFSVIMKSCFHPRFGKVGQLPLVANLPFSAVRVGIGGLPRRSRDDLRILWGSKRLDRGSVYRYRRLPMRRSRRLALCGGWLSLSRGRWWLPVRCSRRLPLRGGWLSLSRGRWRLPVRCSRWLPLRGGWLSLSRGRWRLPVRCSGRLPLRGYRLSLGCRCRCWRLTLGDRRFGLGWHRRLSLGRRCRRFGVRRRRYRSGSARCFCCGSWKKWRYGKSARPWDYRKAR